ncbi:MAG: DUF2953 domain-containing protein [Clostridia bacterium]|nr:DUF2953 domain-containing protein [Clostridia bacterium]
MTAVYIILGILIFFFLILIIPVKVSLAFEDGVFSAIVYYGFIRIFNSKKPRKEKPEKKAKKQTKKQAKKQEKDQKKKKEPSAFSKLFAHKKAKLGLTGAVKFFLDLLKDALSKLVWIVRKIKFRKFRLNLVVASDDAATTAINYGYFCTAIYPTLSFLSANTNLTLKEVDISADYNKTAIDFDLSVNLKTRIIYFLVLAIKLFREYKKLIKEVAKDE